ncbi:MAG: septum formation initiator family protein [Capnocytophaga felis]|nr:septum formation initiator family protein [Capnocytophaga felis]
MKTILRYIAFLKGYKLYVVILLFFLVWMAFFDSNSLLTHRELNKEIRKLHKQRQFLEKEIEKDKKSLQILNTDEGKEKMGREAYYLKHDNEEVFIIEYDTIN